jgi:hypothetical protein
MIETYDQLVAHLVLHGVTKVTVEYSGSGDSGQIDDVIYYNKYGETAFISEKSKIREFIGDFLYNHVLNTIEDWYNNEGGYGIVTIDVMTGEIAVTNNIRIESYDTYYHDFNAFEIQKDKDASH